MLQRVLRAALTIAVLVFTLPITVLAQITPELIEAAKKEGEVVLRRHHRQFIESHRRCFREEIRHQIAPLARRCD